MLSIETTTKLLKLHLRWPGRKDWNGKEDEVLEFYKWLFMNHHDLPEVMALEDIDAVEEFLSRNSHVLWPSSKDEEKWANLRLEPRIENDVNVGITVARCSDTSLEGETIQGRTLDIGLHGMRLTVSDKAPVGTILELGVARDHEGARVYKLTAELRWIDQMEGGYLVGLKLIEDDGFTRWRNDFGAEFVQPVLGNRRKTQ